ncbi:mitochondrial import inner membrane translocase subunit Tim10 isoform X1 [Hemicordylus capensis]|uniref:mitochondrial import inner membrane translocase subunit Tim10 isoform X1 n=1 Tax=Hemicordylus capensis TaxID=884348 RepID=UPI0023049145|nr:mitochondrial import inner membrane translocase subunit Tim10 isoform X1 [Hemicordylus capensis]
MKGAPVEVPAPRASGGCLRLVKHQRQSVMDPLRAQQLAAELEVEMMADMYNRMTNACHRKCVPPHYKEAELSKGESVCLDRCVSKYLDIHERMGKKLTELSMQDEELMKRMQQGAGPA